MSRRWIRAQLDTICRGPCGTLIRQGEPLFMLQWSEDVPPRLRCVACAARYGEQVPDSLPALDEHPTAHVVRPGHGFVKVGKVSAPDFRLKRAGNG